MKLHHLDVVTAFLYPLLIKEIYMTLPPGITSFPGETVRLLSSIYGDPANPALLPTLDLSLYDGSVNSLIIIELEWYLGVRYEKSEDCLLVKASQTAYIMIELIAASFGNEVWHAIKTPMEEGFSVGPDDICADPDPSLVSDYCSLLGRELFVAC
eukprot:3067721-Rhodomonas_salina.2